MQAVFKRIRLIAAAVPLAVTLFQGAAAETVARYGISMADIPLTTGQPDRGAGAYQFTGHTLYDPLVAWEPTSAPVPASSCLGLATEWKVDPKDHKDWTFTLRHGVKFHDGSGFGADAVVWNLDKVLNDKSPQFDAKQSAQVRPRIPSIASYRKVDELTRGDHHQGRRRAVPLPAAVVPDLQPCAVGKAGARLGQGGHPAVGHRSLQAGQAGAARAG